MHPILAFECQLSRPEIFICIFMRENWGPERLLNGSDSWLGGKMQLVGKISLTQLKRTSFCRPGKGIGRHWELCTADSSWWITTCGQSDTVQGATGVCIALWPFKCWIFFTSHFFKRGKLCISLMTTVQRKATKPDEVLRQQELQKKLLLNSKVPKASELLLPTTCKVAARFQELNYQLQIAENGDKR